MATHLIEVNNQLHHKRAIVVNNLHKIYKVAAETNITGRVALDCQNMTLSEFDEIVNSIDEYPRSSHFIQVTTKLTVVLSLIYQTKK